MKTDAELIDLHRREHAEARRYFDPWAVFMRLVPNRERLIRDLTATAYLEAVERGDLLALRSIRRYAAGDRATLAELVLVHWDLAKERANPSK